MEPALEKYKGIHPGMVLERELKKRKLKKGPFALSIQEYPQTLNEITKGRRGITPALSLKIDRALGMEDGTMLLLQTHYEIRKELLKSAPGIRPDMSVFREVLFWDTDIDKIDWRRQYRAVIERVFERGNEAEKNEVINFYGEEKVIRVTGSSRLINNRLPLFPHLKTT